MPPGDEESVVKGCCSELDGEAGVPDGDLFLGCCFLERAPVRLEEIGVAAGGYEDDLECPPAERSPEPADRNSERLGCRARI